MGFVTGNNLPKTFKAAEKKPKSGFLNFAGEAGKEILISVPRALASPFAITYQEGTALLTGERPENVNVPFLGDVGFSSDPRKAAGQALGRAADIGLVAAGGSVLGAGGKAIAKEGIKGGVKAGAKQLIKQAPADFGIGSLYGISTGLSEGEKAEGLLRSAVTGGLIGLALPPVGGAVLKAGILGTKAVGKELGKAIEKTAIKLEEKAAPKIVEKAGKRFYEEKAGKQLPKFQEQLAGAGAQTLRAIQNIPSGFRQRFVNKFEPVTNFKNKLKEGNIEAPDIEELVEGVRYRAIGKAENKLDNYLMLRDSFGDDWKYIKEYSHYLDDLDRLAAGQKIAGDRTSGQVQDDLTRLFSSLPEDKARTIQDGQTKLQSFLRNELFNAVESGRISDEQFNAIRSLHQNYIPHDVLDFLDEELVSGSKGIGRSFQMTKSGIEKAKGSVRDIDDIDSAITRRLIRQELLNEKNKVNLTLFNSIRGSEEKLGFIPLRTAKDVTERRGLFRSLEEEFSVRKELEKNKKINTRLEKEIFKSITEVRQDSKIIAGRAQTFASEFTPKSKIEPLVDKLINRERRITELSAKAEAGPSKTKEELISLIEDQKETIKSIRDEIKSLADIKIKNVDVPDGFTKYSYFRNGIREDWLMPEDLGNALKFMDESGALAAMKFLNNTIVGKAITTPARLIRAVATTRNPFFAFISNPLRDLQTVKITANMKADDYAKGLASAISASKGQADDLYKLARESGGLQAGIYREHKDAEKILAAKLNKTNETSITSKIVTGTGDILTGRLFEAGGQIMEEATRLGVFSRALKNGLTPEQSARLARNASVDFGKSGTWTEVINKFIPFFNARIQGFSNLATAASKDPTKFVRQGMWTAAYPATLLTAHNTKYDSYANIPDYEKRKFWIVMVGQTAGTDLKGKTASIPYYIKIPKGEAQQAISNVVERVLTIGKTKYPESTNRFLTNLIGDTSPILTSSLIPPGFQQWIELKTNYSFFRERQIEPDYTKVGNKWFETKNIEPRFRTQFNTSALAKTLGGILNWSPIKIDYVIKQGVLNDVIRIGDLTAEGWQQQDSTTFQKAGELPFVRSVLGTSAFGEDIRKKEAERQKEVEKNTKKINRLQNRPLSTSGFGLLEKTSGFR